MSFFLSAVLAHLTTYSLLLVDLVACSNDLDTPASSTEQSEQVSSQPHTQALCSTSKTVEKLAKLTGEVIFSPSGNSNSLGSDCLPPSGTTRAMCLRNWTGGFDRMWS